MIAAVWVIGAWRILQMGAYVERGRPADPRAAAVRGPCAGTEIANVRLHQATHRLGRWEVESGMTVLIERRDGTTVNTELWAQGVDFHSRPKVFRAVYHELRDRHLAASTPDRRPGPARPSRPAGLVPGSLRSLGIRRHDCAPRCI